MVRLSFALLASVLLAVPAPSFAEAAPALNPNLPQQTQMLKPRFAHALPKHIKKREFSQKNGTQPAQSPVPDHEKSTTDPPKPKETKQGLLPDGIGLSVPGVAGVSIDLPGGKQPDNNKPGQDGDKHTTDHPDGVPNPLTFSKAHSDDHKDGDGKGDGKGDSTTTPDPKTTETPKGGLIPGLLSKAGSDISKVASHLGSDVSNVISHLDPPDTKTPSDGDGKNTQTDAQATNTQSAPPGQGTNTQTAGSKPTGDGGNGGGGIIGGITSLAGGVTSLLGSLPTVLPIGQPPPPITDTPSPTPSPNQPGDQPTPTNTPPGVLPITLPDIPGIVSSLFHPDPGSDQNSPTNHISIPDIGTILPPVGEHTPTITPPVDTPTITPPADNSPTHNDPPPPPITTTQPQITPDPVTNKPTDTPKDSPTPGPTTVQQPPSSVQPPPSSAPVPATEPASTPVQQTTPSPEPTSVAATGTDSHSQLFVPTTLVLDQSSTAPSEAPTASHTEGIPSNIPHVIPPPGSNGVLPQPPANTTLIQIGFKYALNYPFVLKNPGAVYQIFDILPNGLAYGLGIDANNVTMQSLQPYDTTKMQGFITTVALAYIPVANVQNLTVEVPNVGSELYKNPNSTRKLLISEIDPSFPVVAGAGAGGTGGGNGGGSGGSIQDQNPLDNNNSGGGRVNGTSLGIGLGVVCGAAVYGAAMFFVAKRYKQRKNRHSRSSSMIDTASMVQNGNEPATGATAALMGHSHDGSGYGTGQRNPSRNSNGSGSSRGRDISAPVMAENSLGWN